MVKMLNKEARGYFMSINNNINTIARAKTDIAMLIYNLEKLGFSDTTISNLKDILQDIDNLELLDMKDELMQLFKEVINNGK